MPYDPNRHHRRSIRLKGYDYSQAGAYFITICTQDRACLFGKVVNGEMRLNDAGRMVLAEWNMLPERFPHVVLDAFVVMPNHVHGIVVITNPATDDTATTAPKIVGTGLVPVPNAGTMDAAPNAGTMGAVPDAGTMGAVPDAGTMGAAPDAGTMGAAPNAGTMGAAPNAGTMGAAPNAGTMGAAPDAGMMGAVPDDGATTRVAPTAATIVGTGLVPVPDDGATTRATTRTTTRVAPTVGDIVGAFKSRVTVEYIRGVKTSGWPPFRGRLWQRNYYEHIIRNERALNAIRQYIIENPRRWQMDRENEARTAPDPPAQAIWNMLKQEEADHSPGGER
jgi:putative transposase